MDRYVDQSSAAGPAGGAGISGIPELDCEPLKEVRTGLCLGLMAVDGGGADPKGGGTTRPPDEEFIRKVLSHVAELYELLFPDGGESIPGP